MRFILFTFDCILNYKIKTFLNNVLEICGALFNHKIKNNIWIWRWKGWRFYNGEMERERYTG